MCGPASAAKATEGSAKQEMPGCSSGAGAGSNAGGDSARRATGGEAAADAASADEQAGKRAD